MIDVQAAAADPKLALAVAGVNESRQTGRTPRELGPLDRAYLKSTFFQAAGGNLDGAKAAYDWAVESD